MIDNSAYKLAQQAKEHSDWKSNFEEKRRNEIDQYQKEQSAASEIIALKNKVTELEDLLSRPMREIAEVSGDFKETYDIQQGILANWILGQQAYRETAKIYAEQLGITVAEFSKQYNESVNAVLTNKTKHDNNSSEYEPLASHASAILAIRKKNGKA